MIIDTINKYMRGKGWQPKTALPVSEREPDHIVTLGFRCPASLVSRIEDIARGAQCSKSHVIRAVLFEKFGHYDDVG